MARIGFMASEEMSFENVDGRRRRTDDEGDGRTTTTTDGRRMPGYNISSLISLRLRCANKYYIPEASPRLIIIFLRVTFLTITLSGM